MSVTILHTFGSPRIHFEDPNSEFTATMTLPRGKPQREFVEATIRDMYHNGTNEDREYLTQLRKELAYLPLDDVAATGDQAHD